MIAPPSTRRSTVRLFKIEQTLSFLTINFGRKNAIWMVKQRAADKRATEPMKAGFDIFRHLDDGRPIWVANVQTRAQAEREVASLLRSAPARYFVRDAETGEVITDTWLGTAGETNPAGVTSQRTSCAEGVLFLKVGTRASDCL